ncbi:MAG: amino acid ABC transporter permease [Culicoidibacterales bacterium]
MWALFIEYLPLFIEGIKVTLFLAIAGTFFGIIIGAILAFMRIQTTHFTDSAFVRVIKTLVRWLAIVYIDIIRGTPMIVQASLFYYGLVSGFMPPLIAGLVIISFNTAAYIAEIIRSGINALNSGQMEAAKSLGLTEGQAMIHVILPQVMKNSLPALLNELIVNVKDSAVLSVIQVTELFYSSKSAASSSYQVLESYLIAAVIYLILTLILSRGVSYIVNRSNKKPARISLPVSQTVEEAGM